MEIIYPIGVIVTIFVLLKRNKGKFFSVKDAISSIFWPIVLIYLVYLLYSRLENS